jgi:DNA phosphorothioation-dependent restriction protein DptG
MAVTSASEEDGALKRISHQSLKSIEKKIYYAINDFFENQDYEKDQKYLNEASRRSGHKLFLNLAKKIDFVIPKKGSGARFVMTPEVLKLLVAITVPENGRITYDTFKEIIKSRWGMVFDNRGFSECNKSINGSEIYIDSNVDAWLIEMLDESGLLVHLSDSCALVLHPKQD